MSLRLNENRNGVIGKICHGDGADIRHVLVLAPPKISPSIDKFALVSVSFLTFPDVSIRYRSISTPICSSLTEIITLHRIVLRRRHFSSSNELFEEKIRNDRTGMRCRLPPRRPSSSFHPNLHPGPSIHQIAFPPPPPSS